MKKKKTSKLADIRLVLRPFWQKDKGCVILYILTDAIANTWINVASLIVMSTMIHMVEKGASLWHIALAVLALLAGWRLLDLIINLVDNQYTLPRCEMIKAQINREVFERLKKTDCQYFDSPEFFDRFTVTYGQYADYAKSALRTLSWFVSTIVTVITLVAYIAVQNWIAIVVAVCMMVIQAFIESKRNRLNKARDDSNARSQREKKYFHQTLISRDAAMDLKSTYLSELMKEKYEQAVTTAIRNNKRYDIKGNFLTLYNNLAELGGLAIVQFVTCALVLAGKVSISALVVLTTATSELAYKLQQFSWMYREAGEIALNGERIRTFLEQPSPIEQSESERPAPKTDGENYAFTLQNVSFSYPESSFALKNLNMTIPAGGKIAIVGENGGGKTTLTKLLLRLYDPQSGEILLNGHPLTDYDIEAVRHNIGVAFQDCPVYALSMRENLSAYCKVSDQMMHALSDRLPVDEILKKNEATYDTQITRQFDNQGIMLSGGERQKLSVARVMTQKFGMLIFDEPTAALDPIAEERLSQTILSAGNKTTTILISHRLSNVVNADYIYVFRQGEIVESGTHKDLMAANGYYAEMFTTQAKNYQNTAEAATA